MDNYFYAEDDAEIYDDTAELTQPEYLAIHNVTAQLVHRGFAASRRGSGGVQSTPPNSTDGPLVLDVGCGTGMEALALLRLCPNTTIVAFDKSEKMLGIFRRKLHERLNDGVSRVKTVVGDILDVRWTSEALRGLVPDGRPFDAVISAFLIHHFSLKQRGDLYSRTFRVLNAGGVFVNADLFDFQSPTLSQYAEEIGEDWVSQQLSSNADSPYQPVVQRLSADVGNLRARWLKHLREENIPAPIEPTEATVAAAVRSNGTPSNSQMLLDAGFVEVGCPYRFWQAGVLWAKK